jgi:hypothetical protein
VFVIVGSRGHGGLAGKLLGPSHDPPSGARADRIWCSTVIACRCGWMVIGVEGMNMQVCQTWQIVKTVREPVEKARGRRGWSSSFSGCSPTFHLDGWISGNDVYGGRMGVVLIVLAFSMRWSEVLIDVQTGDGEHE